MNFLSHFYHELPCSDPYFAAGVVLPDILSNYSHRTGEVVKLHENKFVEPDSEAQTSLLKGVKRHYTIDGYFHESEFFARNTEAISHHFKKRDYACFEKRLYAVSHVMLEIMLDRKILMEERSACVKMYTLLDWVDKKEVSKLVALNSPASEPDAVAEHFDGFRVRKFVYDYAEEDRLTELMNSINKRLGNKAFSMQDRELFKLTIHDIENTLFPQKFPKFPTDL